MVFLRGYVGKAQGVGNTFCTKAALCPRGSSRHRPLLQVRGVYLLPVPGPWCWENRQGGPRCWWGSGGGLPDERQEGLGPQTSRAAARSMPGAEGSAGPLLSLRTLCPGKERQASLTWLMLEFPYGVASSSGKCWSALSAEKLNPEQELRYTCCFRSHSPLTSWSRGLACSVLGSHACHCGSQLHTDWPGPSPWHCPTALPALEGAASAPCGKAHRRPIFHLSPAGGPKPGARQGAPQAVSRVSAGASRVRPPGAGPERLRILVLLGLLSAYWVEMKSPKFAARLACGVIQQPPASCL